MSKQRAKNKIEKMAWGGKIETSVKTGAKHERLVAVDMMVGLAMIFVVLGHFTVGFEPDWYSLGLHNWIYTFHMQLFIFLSAFLIRYSYREVKSPLEYTAYIWRKFKKFFVWFIVIGFVVALLAVPLKGAELSWLYLGTTLRNLLLLPRYSEASFLWYVYILFGYYLVSPLFFRLPQWMRVVCCIAAMFLPMLQAGHLFAAYDFCQYTFFYCLGVLCAEWIAEIRGAKVWLWAMASTPFLAFSIWLFTDGISIGFQFPQLGWWLLVTGVAALPFFYLLAMALKKITPINNLLTLISKDCYWIYLLQMFVIWGCVALTKKMQLVDAVPFWLFLTLTTLLALAIPVALAEGYKKIKKQGILAERPAKNTSLK